MTNHIEDVASYLQCASKKLPVEIRDKYSKIEML